MLSHATRPRSRVWCAPLCQVFLLSMRSGAVGLNLTSSNHVFLMEPVMNPALEAQAIGRSWRMGQVRIVCTLCLLALLRVRSRTRPPSDAPRDSV